MSKIQKLELTWVGKDEKEEIEPRILVENSELSHVYNSDKNGQLSLINKDGDFNNMLIHGDNLLALKALEQDFAGKVKCIYIDPPYNTGAAFELYDDNLEHSKWLNLMKPRLDILHNLLKNDGVIFVQIDFVEVAYLTCLLDEIFGRKNHISTITCKVKSSGGLTANDSMFFDASEYILVYAKDIDSLVFNPYKIPMEIIDKNSKTVKNYNQIINNINFESKEYITEIGGIKYYRIKKNNFSITRLQTNTMTKEDFYRYKNEIFRLTALSGGIGKKLKEHTNEFMNNDDLFVYEYVPSKGRDAGKMMQYLLYKGQKVSFLNNYIGVDDRNKTITKLEGITNILDGDLWQGIAAEGGVTMNNGKKPERLLQILFDIATDENDLILDSFLGTGTTCAVAHKMKRKWIGIELGEQCYTHAKVRLDAVINGEQSGISKFVNWQGGGSYKFYELAPSLIIKDSHGREIINPEYNANMLAAAMAKHEGFKYNPDRNNAYKQGFASEKSFIFTTTNHITAEYLDEIASNFADDEYLIINCKSFDENIVNNYKNITIKKIPQSILGKCVFNKDNYNLNIVDLPVEDDDAEE